VTSLTGPAPQKSVNVALKCLVTPATAPATLEHGQGFAQVLANSIRARIQSGQNIYDQAAAIEARTAGSAGGHSRLHSHLGGT
jgi:hypothetical protein